MEMHSTSKSLLASIIIPAHNEATVIAAALERLLPAVAQGFEVIVGCNGCSDDTAAVARSVSPHIHVLETDKKGKFEGLNLADSAAQAPLRIYLDADIRLDDQTLPILVRDMQQTRCLAAAPTFRVDTTRSSWGVKQFYKIWMQLPYFASGTSLGSGFYALSAAGRQRFDQFPNIIADDAFVRSLFQAEEIRIVPHCHFTVSAPCNLRSLIKIKTRSRLGNMQLRQRFPTQAAGGETGLGHLLRLGLANPLHAPSLLVYVFVQLSTLFRAKRQYRQRQFSLWERDDSSRTAPQQFTRSL